MTRDTIGATVTAAGLLSRLVILLIQRPFWTGRRIVGLQIGVAERRGVHRLRDRHSAGEIRGGIGFAMAVEIDNVGHRLMHVPRIDAVGIVENVQAEQPVVKEDRFGRAVQGAKLHKIVRRAAVHAATRGTKIGIRIATSVPAVDGVPAVDRILT